MLCHLIVVTGLSGLACDAMPPAATTAVESAAGEQAAGQTTSDSTPLSVNATLLEQLSLERINRARLRPLAEAQGFGIAVDEAIPGQINGTPKQALAMNAALVQSARDHSRDMIARDYFAHDTPEGASPFERMNHAGYLFITAGENLAWRGTTGSIDEVSTVEEQHADLFKDFDIPNRGHRVTMLNGAFREVGIGVVRGIYTKDGKNYDSIMQSQDFGTLQSSPTFVLGVVYDDTNSNGQYDAGEGTGGRLVTLGGASKTTNSAGGYSFAVSQAGTYTLLFAANKTQSLTIKSGSPNIKVDFVDSTWMDVNLGAGLLN